MTTEIEVEAKETGPGSSRRIGPDSIWIRGLFMLLFILIYGVAEAVLAAVALLQFGWWVFSEEQNERLDPFAKSLCEFIYQVAGYWTFTHDQKPFPFSDWPKPRMDSGVK